MEIKNSQVPETLSHLPASPQPDQPGIRELLTELKRGIEQEDNLPSEAKEDLLLQVQSLAEAWREPKEEETRSQADIALNKIRNAIANFPNANGFIEISTQLLPQLAVIFGVKE